MKKLNLKSIEAFLRKGEGFFYACLRMFNGWRAPDCFGKETLFAG